MITKTYSATVYGVDAKVISIEVNIVTGTKMVIVGLPDNAVKESQHRVESVIKHLDRFVPRHRIIVNLAPASIKKEGAAYDLPIALAILHSSEQAHLDNLGSYMIAGELALDGTLRPIRGTLPMALEAKRQGYKGFILPKENSPEAAIVEGLDIIPVQHIQEAIDFLSGQKKIKPLFINPNILFTNPDTKAPPHLDMRDIQGQSHPKRALEIAAAGGHNLLMIGPPGVGKSMLSKRLPTILPPLSLHEALETTKIYSVAGKMGQQPLITQRPFRVPHHTISEVALVGGGSIPQPGEISLAHHGVLSLEELTEFKRSVLEVLRQPLEDQCITVTRTKLSLDFPANFMLIASMNPCPCGYYTHPEKACTCPPTLRKKYLSKISGPLLDRIDIHLQVHPVKFNTKQRADQRESSQTIRTRVINTRQRQCRRFAPYPTLHSNAMIPPSLMQKMCPLTTESQTLLTRAMKKLSLSTRAYDRILKVARTIADLEEHININPTHIAEAIHLRSLDRESWAS
ncbi:MAG: YifB family Mg chelatase-like AAA ATPase [Bacteroidota bacterium]